MSIKNKLIAYAGKVALAQLLVKPLFLLFLVLALTLQFFYFSATPAAAEDTRFGIISAMVFCFLGNHG